MTTATTDPRTIAQELDVASWHAQPLGLDHASDCPVVISTPTSPLYIVVDAGEMSSAVAKLILAAVRAYSADH